MSYGCVTLFEPVQKLVESGLLTRVEERTDLLPMPKAEPRQVAILLFDASYQRVQVGIGQRAGKPVKQLAV